jgi:hypothetical protein
MHILLIIGGAIVCVAIGILGHAFLAKEEAATRDDLQRWAASLRSAFNSDLSTAKSAVNALIAEIEKKL